LCVFAIVLFLLVYDRNSQPKEIIVQPKAIIVGQSIHDFGNIKVDVKKEIQAKFVIKNVGSSTLDILDCIPSGCSLCIDIHSEKNNLKSGETTEITVVYRPLWQEGPWKKRILIKTNEIRLEPLELIIKGFSVLTCRVIPDKIIVDKLHKKSEQITKVLIVGPTNNKDFKVLSVDSSCDNITLSDIHKVENRMFSNREAWEVSMLLKGKGINQWEDSFTIITSLEPENAFSKIRVPVYIKEQSDYEIKPSIIFMSAKSPREYKVFISSHVVQNPVDVVNIQAPEGLVVTPITRIGNQIQFKVRAGNISIESNYYKENIIIELANGDIITIPVIFTG